MNLPESKTVRSILKPAAFIYGIGASLKMRLYDDNILNSVSLPAPVISIGNITVGGTGKTPITIDLANRLSAQGLKVGILSRGYKRKSSADQVIVSDGTEILVSCEEAGDEPYLMARSCPETVVISGASRVETGKTAIDKFGCEVLLMDDGFQHVKLKRDRNLVLIDYTDSLEDEAVLPAGRLREPLSGLSRATDIIVTKVPEEPDEIKLGKLRKTVLSNLGTREEGKEPEFFYASFEPCLLRSAFEELPLKNLSGSKVVSISAIARPETFHNMIEKLGFNIVEKMSFDDHHWFNQNDHEKLETALKSKQADFILTTEKDLVRLNLKEDLARRTFAVVLATKWLDKVPCLDLKGAKDSK